MCNSLAKSGVEMLLQLQPLGYNNKWLLIIVYDTSHLETDEISKYPNNLCLSKIYSWKWNLIVLSIEFYRVLLGTKVLIAS